MRSFAAFASISLGNGKYAIGMKQMKLAIPASNYESNSDEYPQEVRIITNNYAVASDKLTMKYSIIPPFPNKYIKSKVLSGRGGHLQHSGQYHHNSGSGDR